MLLAASSDILSNLGFDSMTDINFAITQALDAAEEQLSALLNTEFAAGTFTDMFYVERPRYEVGRAVKTQFRLTHAFVTGGLPAGSVLVNGYVSALTGQASQLGTWPPYVNLPDGSPNIDVSASVQMSPADAERGLITDYTNRYRNHYVQVTYAAGFPTDPTDSSSYLLSSVPDWLQQAAKIVAMLALADNASLEEAQIKIDKQLLGSQYRALMSRKVRFFPNALLPL